jgi:hypothetical protein
MNWLPKSCRSCPLRKNLLKLPASDSIPKVIAGRSTVRNLEEGYKRSNTSTYMEFISFSQGSLEEVKGDIRELTEDGFLPSKPGSSLQSIGINLKDLNTALKPKGNLEDNKGDYGLTETKSRGPKNSGNQTKLPDSASLFLYRPLTILYLPLSKVHEQDLTYEIFIELVNKTDYLLRVLVKSLEKKLKNDKVGYRLDQERIKEKFRR